MSKRGAQSRDEKRRKELALGALKQFRLIYGSVRSHFRDVEEVCGVSGSQLWVMHEVNRTPGVGISELSQRLSIHQTTCSQLVEKLVARGYVLKTRSTEDQRRVGLALTKTAARVLQRAPGPAEGLLPEALMELPATTLEALTLQLRMVTEQLRLPDEKAAERPLSDL